MPPYVLINKAVGQTPLEVVETWRKSKPDLTGVPLAYAGRLDPMASGKLLVLIGEECKKQTTYHHLDKEYQIQVLFNVSSDSGDVLGIVREKKPEIIPSPFNISETLQSLIGEINLLYPIFSSKTVKGKPLHTWVMEGRLNEIEIPSRTSQIYTLNLTSTETQSRSQIKSTALAKINSLPPVTDPRKSLGNDFRRPEVLASWEMFGKEKQSDNFLIANITCICSSGTYMRTLAEVIAEKLSTTALAFLINRSQIGIYSIKTNSWKKTF